MHHFTKFLLVMVPAVSAGAGCKAGKGPMAPNEQAQFYDGSGDATSGSTRPIDTIESKDIIIGNNPGGSSDDGSKNNVPPGSDPQAPAADGAAGAGTATPTPTPSPAPPFYPASCAEIKAAKPDALSGIFKIYLNAGAATRVAMDASCDMTEDGGGWTLVLNYSHKANTNPPLALRTTDLPLLGGDTLGTDESALGKNWGHTSNLMLANFAVKDLRFYCRSSQNTRIIHFKTPDANCLRAAQQGAGSCSNVAASFAKLTGHSGILPASADDARMNEGDFALTRDSFSQDQIGRDISWSIKGNNDNAWECDFGSNDFEHDTIHRIWIR